MPSNISITTDCARTQRNPLTRALNAPFIARDSSAAISGSRISTYASLFSTLSPSTSSSAKKKDVEDHDLLCTLTAIVPSAYETFMDEDHLSNEDGTAGDND